MRIQDFERRSGLERATIRFYEKEGLLCPHRTENGYRDYSEADLEDVKKIKLLRQLGLPLDKIRELQKGSAVLIDAVDKQIDALNEHVDAQQRAKEVCGEIKSAGETYMSLNADKYQNMLNCPPPTPNRKPETYREILRLDHHPGRRFFARLFDITILYLLILIFVIVILRIRNGLALWIGIISILVWWVMIPLEALMLTLFGTTPGKLIFGIQLKYHYDVRFTFRAALRRAWLVFRYGLGWNLPSYNIYRLGKSYLECEEYPDMLWDDETDVTYRMWTHTDLSGIFACVCLIFLLSNVVYDDILLPKYRDTVTISEFSENYNFYAEILQVPFRLNPDGTWVDDPDTGGDELTDFTYSLEDGQITAISQDIEERGFKSIDPLCSYQTTALIAFTAAEKINDTSRITQSIEYMEDIAHYYKGTSFDSSICGVPFHWEITYENCGYDETNISSRLEATNEPRKWNNKTDAYVHIVMIISKDE